MIAGFPLKGRIGRIPFRKILLTSAGLAGAAAVLLAVATAFCFQDPVVPFREIAAAAQSQALTDHAGQPLAVSYAGPWNTSEIVPLHNVPPLLRAAFLLSEDRRFFEHAGVDWRARAVAVFQNLRQGRTVRGASTIAEQTVRILHPRTRNLWSKWMEGLEALALTHAIPKATLLEFYLNQIPYAGHRRGVAQATRYYFDRSLDTLSPAEALALVVLARAPSGYDLYRAPTKIAGPLAMLAARAEEAGLIDARTRAQVRAEALRPAQPSLPIEARHFARFVRLSSGQRTSSLRTTLDGGLQKQVQTLLDRRVDTLARRQVRNGAALVVDRRSGQVLAWVVAGADRRADKGSAPPPGAEIDPVTTPRQPGSALKPFLYALALEKGWTAATMIDDSPLAEAIGAGLHRFRNYSEVHYGPVPLREALGNSLNIPALRTIRHVGPQVYLKRLHDLGFDTLDRGVAIYDEGLALGDGEVTLFALVQAYAALANGGVFRPLQTTFSADPSGPPVRRVYSPETATLIADILSDPSARALEFGTDSVLNLPVPTAIKTGTSTAYRDAWVAGFDDRYVVGVWMGNLDRAPMDDVTGSTGPALTLRGIFALLNRDGHTRPLALSPRLSPRQVCARPPDKSGSCPMRTEWFAARHEKYDLQTHHTVRPLELVRPTEGLHIARDPRIPAPFQKFRFELAGLQPDQNVTWTLDGKILGHTDGGTILWPLEKGPHDLSVRVSSTNEPPRTLHPVRFLVK